MLSSFGRLWLLMAPRLSAHTRQAACPTLLRCGGFSSSGEAVKKLDRHLAGVGLSGLLRSASSEPVPFVYSLGRDGYGAFLAAARTTGTRRSSGRPGLR